MQGGADWNMDREVRLRLRLRLELRLRLHSGGVGVSTVPLHLALMPMVHHKELPCQACVCVCGAELPPATNFCSSCGAQQPKASWSLPLTPTLGSPVGPYSQL